MRTKEEILFSHMDEALQVSTENQLKAMQEFADEMTIDFLDHYLGGRTSKFEIKRVIEKYKIEYITDNEPF